MQCDHALFLITSCAQSAVPVSVRHAIVRVATRPGRHCRRCSSCRTPTQPDAGSGRVAVEGCLWEHHTTPAEIFRRFSYQGPAAPLALRAFTPLLPSRPGAPRAPFQLAVGHARVREATRQGRQSRRWSRRRNAHAARTPEAAGLQEKAALHPTPLHWLRYLQARGPRIFGYCGVLNVFPSCSCAGRNNPW